MTMFHSRFLSFPIAAALAASLCTPMAVAATGAAGEVSETALQEVVVTAQRRESTAQKTPLAMDVLSASALKNAGVVQIHDLMEVTPGLQIGSAGAVSQIYIRGVGDFGATPITNPAVALNVDGTYVAESQAAEGNMFDLARIEVLKGPQGTLYGRNASGGAINLISVRPSFDRVSGYGDVEFGNYGAKTFEGALNLPASDHLAFRVSGIVVDRHGYATDGMDDDKHQAARVQALWRNDNTSLLVAGEYSHFGGNGSAYVAAGPALGGLSPYTSSIDRQLAPVFFGYAAAQGLCIPGGFFPGYNVAGDCPRVAPYPSPPFPPGTLGPYESLAEFPSMPPHQDNKHWAARAELKTKFGGTTLTVIPAHRHSDTDYNAYPDFTYSQNAQLTANSIEARLSRSSASLRWTTGVFYYDEKLDSDELIPGGLIQNNHTITRQKTRSEAAFGEATFNVQASTRLIAGLRYTSDHKTIDGTVTASPPSIAFLPTSPSGIACFGGLPNPCLLETFTGVRDFNTLTWKAGVEHDLTPQNMLFATVSTGFKAGGFNQAIENGSTSEASSFQPESVTAIELGSKNRFLNQTLQINLEAFYWKYRHPQEPHVVVDGVGQIAFSYQNAGDATSAGANIDLIWQATPADRIHVGIEYLYSKFDTFSYDSPPNPAGGPFVKGAGNGFTSFDPLSPLSATTGCATSAITSGANAGGVHVDCSGFPLTHAPEWSGSLGYNHRFAIQHGGNVTAGVNALFATSRWLAIDFLPSEQAPSYVTIDANLTYHAASGHWSVTAFGRNLSNVNVYSSAIEDPFVAGYISDNIGPPRTYGVRLSTQF